MKNNYSKIEDWDKFLTVCLLTKDRDRSDGTEGRRGVPALIIGDPGSAKTSKIRQFAEANGIFFQPLIGSTRDSTDFSGVPCPGDDEQFISMKAVEWVKNVIEATTSPVIDKETNQPVLDERGAVKREPNGKWAIVGLDELPNTHGDVQAAMLNLLYGAEVGNIQLPPRVVFFAMGNEICDSPNATEMASAMNNRFCHVEMENIDSEAWTDYMFKFFEPRTDVPGKELKALEAKLKKNFKRCYMEEVSLATAFVNTSPGSLGASEKVRTSNIAWPSKRTWDMAVRAGATAKALYGSNAKTENLISNICTGLLGRAATNEYFNYRAKQNLPNPFDILDKGDISTIKWSDGSILVVTNKSLIEISLDKMRNRKWDEKKNSENLLKYLKACSDNSKTGLVDAFLRVLSKDKDPEVSHVLRSIAQNKKMTKEVMEFVKNTKAFQAAMRQDEIS